MHYDDASEEGLLLAVLGGCICWIVATRDENLLVQMLQVTGRCIPRRGKRVINTTKRFYDNDRLTWAETITDGFYDPGAGRKLLPLDEYPDRDLTPEDLELGCREIIIIDSTIDKPLQRCVNMLRCMEGVTNPEMRVSLVKKAVGMLFNGEQGDITAKTYNAIINKPTKRLLGDLKHGVCRHYSLATKYFCDVMGIPAWLQRGTHIDERHGWVVCSLSSRFILIDMALEGDTLQPSVWPDRSYSPMMPKAPPQSGLILPNVFPNEEVGGYFPLPTSMTRITGIQGGVCVEYTINENVRDFAKQQLANPCQYTVEILDVSDTEKTITIENIATTVDLWIGMRMGEVFDATKMVKIVGMVLVQLHSAGIYHGDVGTHSVAVFASPLYPGDIRLMKVLFPTSSRSKTGSPASDWTCLRRSLLDLAPHAKKIPLLLKQAADGDIHPFLQWIDNTEKRVSN
eukprot:TRINITY_DN11206_c0_g1_i2.p1 TRINITY_DN11206_c0_g1~~TRINITY_DN11206_c0_g1_i2.p1  ORF type:complete len:456 (+),score=81.71 TRINITY_DN11206_c0_g1_i2:41-1408(+)